MSANEDDFGIGPDLEKLLDGDAPTPAVTPSTKARAGRKAPVANKPEPAPEPIPVEPTPAVQGLTLDDLRGALTEMRESLKAELKAELAPSNVFNYAPVPPVGEPVPAVTSPVADAGPVELGEGDILVHVLEDGFTVGNTVYYRGQEIVVPATTEWANLTNREQFLRWKKRYFALGPWEGEAYDLSEATNDSDRARLLEATRRHQELVRAL